MSDDYTNLRGTKRCTGIHGCHDRKYDKSQTDCQECAEDAYQAIIDSIPKGGNDDV